MSTPTNLRLMAQKFEEAALLYMEQGDEHRVQALMDLAAEYQREADSLDH